jgi:hypothetical protein
VVPVWSEIIPAPNHLSYILIKGQWFQNCPPEEKKLRPDVLDLPDTTSTEKLWHMDLSTHQVTADS